MRIAIPECQGRVSPVLDSAARLLVVRRHRGQAVDRREIPFGTLPADGLARSVAELGVDVLLCAAVSQPLLRALERRGIRVMSHLCGEVEAIIEAFCRGRLKRCDFRMPGCWGVHSGGYCFRRRSALRALPGSAAGHSGPGGAKAAGAVQALGRVLAFGVGGLMLLAQETPPGESVQRLQQQLRQLQEQFEQTQRQQQQQIETLRKQIEALQTGGAAPALAPPAPTAGSLPAQTGAVAPGEPLVSASEVKPAWSPAAPITLLGGQRNYLNLSFDALFSVGTSTADDIPRLELGGHDPVQRGFTAQNLETVFEGNVDPYFRAQASLVGHLAPDGDFDFEAEEAYAETLSLPANLQVKGGQYLTEFGRINPTHPHTWSFVDVPLVAGRFLGPEGLRNPGASVSWMAPTPFYSVLFLAVQNSQGSTAYSFRGEGHSHDGEGHALLFGRERLDVETESLGDMLFAPRYAVSFDLTDNQTLLAGASAAFGPNNTGTDTDTQIYGVDLTWKWKSPRHHAGFPFVAWQTEFMTRRFEAGADAAAGLPRETLLDYGAYSQVTWGFRNGWTAGLRGDWVSGERGAYYPDPDRDTRWRVAPSLTWYPTEFSKLRLQYNYDDRKNVGVDHSVWLQFEFLLGAHAAHKF